MSFDLGIIYLKKRFELNVGFEITICFNIVFYQYDKTDSKMAFLLMKKINPYFHKWMTDSQHFM